VLVGIFADIHANREAFEACLRQAREHGAEHNIFLGDYVGYGADPEWTVSMVMDLAGRDGVAVRGNHDNAVADLREDLNVEAQVAMEWTRGELGRAERRFLEELPLTRTKDARLCVHADASDPKRWRYVTKNLFGRQRPPPQSASWNGTYALRRGAGGGFRHSALTFALVTRRFARHRRSANPHCGQGARP